tara:strand:- start:971 stop:1477 length:507 start_codon:yes stop_codon:yes gene_type:complete
MYDEQKKHEKNQRKEQKRENVSVSRMAWTEEENELLDWCMENVEDTEESPRWRNITQIYFPERTEDSVRNYAKRREDRRNNVIYEKKVSESREERYSWTKKEDDLLITLILDHGMSWNLISAQFLTRTAHAIRNRYFRIQHRTLRCLSEPRDTTDYLYAIVVATHCDL